MKEDGDVQVALVVRHDDERFSWHEVLTPLYAEVDLGIFDHPTSPPGDPLLEAFARHAGDGSLKEGNPTHAEEPFRETKGDPK